MEIRNRLRASRGEGAGHKGGKKGTEVAKEHV